MKTAALHALKTVYASFPDALVSDGVMILGFTLIGIGFYLFFEPGRLLSLRAALDHVFRRELFRHRTSRVDILHFVLAIGLWIPVVGALVTAFLTMNVRDVLIGWFGARDALMQADWAIVLSQFAVIFLCRDFGTYVGHYLLHKVPVLWSVHRTHHSAEVLTFFTSARAHPLEYLHAQSFIALFGGLGGGIFLYLTGTSLHATPIAILVGTGFFFETFGLAQHSHLPISFGKLNYVLLAPVLHQIHHSAEPRHRDKNLGGHLSVFDWLFGTIYVPKGREDYRWGLNHQELGENNPHPRLRDFYFEPASHAWRLLTRRG
ncbi:MAG TPA: sterol desaturase family protein [Rhizomicrobium sp.]|nr:sterol desaturase family protein [Rhizomicrobium sp.]